jgi:hypothetical protein
MLVNRYVALAVLTVVACSGTDAIESWDDDPVAVSGADVGGTVELTVDPLIAGVATLVAAVAVLTDTTVSFPPRSVGREVFRGVGNNIGVTATTRAVKSKAIESLLSIYGTGSKPPGRKG